MQMSHLWHFPFFFKCWSAWSLHSKVAAVASEPNLALCFIWRISALFSWVYVKEVNSSILKKITLDQIYDFSIKY